jgi:hypothetical protein
MEPVLEQAGVGRMWHLEVNDICVLWVLAFLDLAICDQAYCWAGVRLLIDIQQFLVRMCGVVLAMSPRP